MSRVTIMMLVAAGFCYVLALGEAAALLFFAGAVLEVCAWAFVSGDREERQQARERDAENPKWWKREP